MVGYEPVGRLVRQVQLRLGLINTCRLSTTGQPAKASSFSRAIPFVGISQHRYMIELGSYLSELKSHDFNKINYA